MSESPNDPHVLGPGLAPTPFTAVEIRDACCVGRQVRALIEGGIDVYPEYTGTLARVVLRDSAAQSVAAIRAALRPRGVTISEPLGFDNTYALGVRAETAERLGLRTISDLRGHPELRAAFTSGFLEREDGWSGLRRRYGPPAPTCLLK